jgi:hypothetical protein
LGNYLSLKYGDKYFLIGNIVANLAFSDRSIENVFIDSIHDHYYLPLSGRTYNNKNWQTYYYQTQETQTDLFNAMDFLLFDKQQSNIAFRE